VHLDESSAAAYEVEIGEAEGFLQSKLGARLTPAISS
jgi:hypothetical protein